MSILALRSMGSSRLAKAGMRDNKWVEKVCVFGCKVDSLYKKLKIYESKFKAHFFLLVRIK